MNALADGPDLGFAGQGGERLDRIIGHHIVELAHQSLVGTEDDGADRPARRCPCSFGHRGRRLVLPKARAQAQFHGAIVVGQRAHRLLVLSDARSGQGLHRADDGLEIAGAADLAAQARRGVAHGFSSGPVSPRLGLERRERLAGDFDDRFAIFVAQLVGGFESRATPPPGCSPPPRCTALLGVRHLVERHGVEELRGQGQQDGDLRGHGHRVRIPVA